MKHLVASRWPSPARHPLEPHALAYDKPLCASLDGFTLHTATRAGASHPAGREALLRCVLRPPVAQERVELRPYGLVRITLKNAYADGTDRGRHRPAVVAVSARHQRAPTAPAHHPPLGSARPGESVEKGPGAAKCHGRMRLLAMVEDPANVARLLAAVGEATEVPPRSPGRGPPYWKSRVLRRQALGEEDDALGRGVQDTA